VTLEDLKKCRRNIREVTMNMRKTYRPGLPLGLDNDGLRRWCRDIIINGPDQDVGPALAIMEELNEMDRRQKAEAKAKDKLTRAMNQLKRGK
jgi:hypothetical protein